MTTYYFPDEPFNPNRHLIFTTSLIVTSMTLALITCDLGMVFELIGATSAAALAYIFPPLCYIKLSSASRREKIPAYVCVGFGLVVMGVSVVQAVANAITSKYFAGRRFAIPECLTVSPAPFCSILWVSSSISRLTIF
jgi:sodium-coupled neutral amino acid transporter 11